MDRRLPAESGSLTFRAPRIEKADILAFSSAFDPQPAHLDEAAALQTPLRGLAASGWHTCAVVAQGLEVALAKVPDYLGIDGIDELRWLRPVRPEDELFGAVTLGPPARCTCGSTFDRRPAVVEVRDGRGKCVLRWSCHVLFGPRRSWIPLAPCALRRVRSSKVAGRPGEHLVKFFEDVHPGDEIALGSYAFGSRNVGIFEGIVGAGGYEVARCKPVHVKGWNVVAGWMRLIVAYYQRRAAELDAAGLPVPQLGPAAGLRWLRWLAPVALGERISFRSWVEHKVHAAGPGRWGLLVAGAEGYNDSGELVICFYPQFLLERRAASATL
jgi:acyl dehydratase